MKTKGREVCPSRIKRALIIEQTGRCFYCNISLVGIGIEYDHIIPFSYLGFNPADNWVACCLECNRLKSNRILRSEADLAGFCVEMISRHGSIGEGWPEGASKAFKGYFQE